MTMQPHCKPPGPYAARRQPPPAQLPTTLGLPTAQPPCPTDDTQMTIALARSLLECGRADAGHAAQAYAREFDKRRGYGGTAALVGGGAYPILIAGLSYGRLR